MENATQIVTATPVVPVMSVLANSAVATRGKRNTIPKLTAAEASKLPGAIAPVVKKKEREFIYSILFVFPVTEKTWSAVEAGKVHDFALQLDTQASLKGLGRVTSVGVTDGNFDVTLTLLVSGTQASHGDPATKTFAELKDFLSTATGTPYTVKVNGTRIGNGVLQAS